MFIPPCIFGNLVATRIGHLNFPAGPQLLFVRDEFAEPRCRLTGIEIPIQLVMGKFPPEDQHMGMGQNPGT